VARPLDLPPEEVARRPDVLVIESGEIELPSDVHMKDIGLPRNVIYACLAETIVLALEGRFEVYTIGRNTEWQKVKEIYKLGLKHGMKLAAISGVNGVFSDEDIAEVVKLAKAARKTWKSGDSRAGTPTRKAPVGKKQLKKKATARTSASKAKKKPGVKEKTPSDRSSPRSGSAQKGRRKKTSAKKAG